MKFVDIVHFWTIFITSNQKDWFSSKLDPLEGYQLEIIAWPWQLFPVDLFLLGKWDLCKVESLQIDYIERVTRVNPLNASIDNKFLSMLLDYPLVMCKLGWIFASNPHLWPGGSLYFSTMSQLRFGLKGSILAIEEIDVHLPHITETALLQILSTMDIEPIDKETYGLDTTDGFLKHSY